MKVVTLYAPFTGGMVTDQPAHQIGPQNSLFAQDGYSPNGFFRQRNAWAYDGTTADVADNLTSVYRTQFILADVTRTLTGDDDGDLFIHESAAVGTAIFAGAVNYLPRCVYRDEVIWCAQDGTTPLLRYSGAALTSDTAVTGADSVSGTATVNATTGTWVAGAAEGSYLPMGDAGATNVPPFISPRVIERVSSSSLTLEGIKFSSSVVGVNNDAYGIGYTYPCVNVYDAGTGSFDNANDEFDGTGTQWSSFGVRGFLNISGYGEDGLLAIRPTGTSAVHHIYNMASNTTLDLAVHNKTDTNINYAILRRCPFTDAAAHKGSLWGTGVAQYGARVYVSPVGWNPALPPGFDVPLDPLTLQESENVNDFLLDYIDVPAEFDGDPVVAILSSPNPLLVLKRKSVYGIYGSFGGLSADMIADGIGCIDIRSAQSYDEGQFWAGENGIFWYSNGSITDLTKGKINREWRALTRDFDYGTSDYCTLFVASGHLVVHITTGGGTTQRTYLCDLRDQSWQSRITNVNARYGYTSRIAGEKEKAFWVSNDRQGRVMDFAPALDGSGTADDDAGSAPRLKAHTTSAIAQSGGIDGLTRLVDLNIHANVVDAGAAASTQLEVSVVSGGGIGNTADSTKTLDTINSDTVDRIDRHQRRVAREGRFHQVQFEVDTLGTDTNATKVEIHQINARIRESRRNA